MTTKSNVKIYNKGLEFNYFMSYTTPDTVLGSSRANKLADIAISAGNYENIKLITTYKLHALGLSVRAFNILMKYNISNVEDLTRYSWENLIKLKKLGQITLQEIICTMQVLGFKYIDASSTPHYCGTEVSCQQTPQTNNSVQNLQPSNSSTNNTDVTIDDVPEKYKKYVAKGIAEEVKAEMSTLNTSTTHSLINKLIQTKQQSNALIYNGTQLPKVKLKNTHKHIPVPPMVKIKAILSSVQSNISLIYDLNQSFIITHQDYLCDSVFNSYLSSQEKRELLRFIEEQCNVFNK